MGAGLAVFGGVKLGGHLQFMGEKAAIKGPSDHTFIEFDVIGQTGADQEKSGTLKGTWRVDTAIQTSDRRLKRQIEPLQREITKKLPPSDRRTGSDRTVAVDWLLRELRPVSFRLRTADDSKIMVGRPRELGRPRYGFVAQEVERTMPNLVQTVGKSKAMLYQDLIAIITLAAQDHQERLEGHRGEVSKLRGMVKTLSQKMGRLQDRVARIFVGGATVGK